MAVLLRTTTGRYALAEVLKQTCISARLGCASQRRSLSHSARRSEDDSGSDEVPRSDIIVKPLVKTDPYFDVIWNRDQPTKGIYVVNDEKDFSKRRAHYNKELHDLRVRYAADVRKELESRKKPTVVSNATVDVEALEKMEQEEREYEAAKAAWVAKLEGVRAEEKAVRHARSLKNVAAIKKAKHVQCKRIFTEQKAASHSFIVTDDDALLDSILNQRLEEEVSFNSLGK